MRNLFIFAVIGQLLALVFPAGAQDHQVRGFQKTINFICASETLMMPSLIHGAVDGTWKDQQVGTVRKCDRLIFLNERRVWVGYMEVMTAPHAGLRVSGRQLVQPVINGRIVRSFSMSSGDTDEPAVRPQFFILEDRVQYTDSTGGFDDLPLGSGPTWAREWLVNPNDPDLEYAPHVGKGLADATHFNTIYREVLEYTQRW